MRASATALWLSCVLAACAAAEPVLDGWIDRIEGDRAVVVVEEGGRYRETVVPVVLLPAGAGEGDVVRGGDLDSRAREVLRARVEARQRRLLRGRGEPSLAGDSDDPP